MLLLHRKGYSFTVSSLSLLGKPDEALNSYQQAIKLKSDHSVAYVNMGRLMKSLGEFDKAEKAFKK